MHKIHLISGLGADGTAFSQLGLFSKTPVHNVDWISNGKEEALESHLSLTVI